MPMPKEVGELDIDSYSERLTNKGIEVTITRDGLRGVGVGNRSAIALNAAMTDLTLASLKAEGVIQPEPEAPVEPEVAEEAPVEDEDEDVAVEDDLGE